MFNRRQRSHKSGSTGWVSFGMILLLCVGIMAQMLGAPVTLLNPAGSGNALGASLLEGFSVPPTLPHVMLSSESVPVIERHPFGQVSGLVTVPFHPPLR